MAANRTITVKIDKLDESAILDAIARYQVEQRFEGDLLLPNGSGDLRGRILAEICRDWSDYRDRVAAGIFE